MKNPPRYRAMVFDLFGTLIETASFEGYALMVRRMGEALGAPDAGAFKAAWLASRPARISGGFPGLPEAFRHIAASLHLPAPSEEAIRRAEAESEAFLRPVLNRAKPEALETLAALKGMGLKLGLLSDCYRTTARLWPETPMALYFDAAVFSCEAGFRKPAPELYALICRRLGVEPREVLYAGDGGGHELRGAREAGMTAVLVENAEPDAFLPDGHREGAHHVVHSLHEILHLLEREPPPGL